MRLIETYPEYRGEWRAKNAFVTSGRVPHGSSATVIATMSQLADDAIFWMYIPGNTCLCSSEHPAP